MKEETISFIKNKFADCKNILPSLVNSLPDEAIDELKEELKNVPEYGSIRNIVYCIAKGIELPTCRKCGKRLTYHQFLHKRQYCSNECKNSSDERTEKQRNTVLERYGTDCVLRKYPRNKTDEEKERTREARRKRNEIRKYGSDSLSSSEKRKMTMLKNHGVSSVAEIPEVRGKIVASLKEKYGDNPFSVMNKMAEKTNIERYGVSNPLSSNEIRKKTRDTFVAHALDRMLDRWKNDVVPLFSRDEYGNMHGRYKWKCVHCGNEFESSIYTTDFSSVDRYMPRCLVCHPFVEGTSKEEKEVLGFVKSIYDGEVVENCRTLIQPYELDIWIPEKNVAIEFDGLYWHSDVNGTGFDYHLMKTEMCSDHGVRLIHVFENEWNEKQDIVKDRIRSVLGIDQKNIYARKCVVKEIDSKTSNDFLEANHLQGSDNSSIRYGLFSENGLVSVMTFGKPRFDRKRDWEMIRFASKLGTRVTGGASRLLAHFRKSHSGSIVSYADRRYSDGNLYDRLGFNLESISSPNYVWIKKNVVLTRYQCQKHLLAKLLGDGFDEGKTEAENMQDNGWIRVFDCGNLVYVLQ